MKKIQEKCNFKKITSDLHVIELYYDIMAAWKKSSDLVSNEKYYTHFIDSLYGQDLRVLKPLVQYTTAESTPHWSGRVRPSLFATIRMSLGR